MVLSRKRRNIGSGLCVAILPDQSRPLLFCNREGPSGMLASDPLRLFFFIPTQPTSSISTNATSTIPRDVVV